MFGSSCRRSSPDPWYTWKGREDFLGKRSNTILRKLICLNFGISRPLVHLERQGGHFREKVEYYFAEIDLPKSLGIFRPLVHLERQGGLFWEKVKYYFAEINLPKFSELLDPCYTWKGREDFLVKRSNAILRKFICLNFWNY